MSELISDKFHDYVFNQSELSGVKDQISEINDIVSRKNIALSVSLDSGAGEKYFYESMKLAENVIKSFETEQPKSKLNENQEIVLEWLQETHKEHVVSPFVLFYQLTSRHSLLTDGEILDVFDKLTDKEEMEVLQAFATWALDQC